MVPGASRLARLVKGLRAAGKNQWVPRPRSKYLVRVLTNKPTVATPRPRKLKKIKTESRSSSAVVVVKQTIKPVKLGTLQFDGVLIEDRFCRQLSHSTRGLQVTTLRNSNAPLLTIITRRHPRRFGSNYRRHVASITHQVSNLMEVVEISGCTSVAAANTSLSRSDVLSNALGQYVMVLDDDDFLADAHVVQRLSATLKKTSPTWLMVPVQMPSAVLPTPWGAMWRPLRGTVGSPCMVIRRDVWDRCCGAWASDKAADWSFSLRLWERGFRPVWMDGRPLVVVPAANEGRFEGGLTPPTVITTIAYDQNKDLGKAYNEVMAAAPEDAWVCFLDHDAYFTSNRWITLIEKAVAARPNAGMFTVVTNRIANSQQILKGVDRNNHEFDYHNGLGSRRALRGGIVDVTRGNLISGVVMCISKRAWRAAGGFHSGFLGVDNKMHQQLRKQGFGVYLISGVYVYHWYRSGGDTAHLKKVKRVVC